MRDRLIELFKQADEKADEFIRENDHMDFIPTKDELAGVYADHLLANGVIVPPCYIGQDVWHITKHYDGRIEIGKGKVSMLQQKSDKSWKIRITVKSSCWDFTPDEIGTRYFLTKDEAERALERSKE